MATNVHKFRGRMSDAEEPRRSDILPEDCPVTPLGVQGNVAWMLDALGQLKGLTPQQLGRRWLAHLFTPQVLYLEKNWPRLDDKGNSVGIRSEAAADDLVRACGTLGVWDPYARVRGRGAWRGADGDLVLHLGDKLWIRGLLTRPSVRGDVVYPVEAARPPPDQAAQPGGDDGPAAELLTMLRSWSWQRPELDPLLLLGWVGAAMVGGALTWRPGAWLTGDRGTGKSTLQELLKHLFGDGQGILSVANTTAAGIRQRVGYATLPVALDELEPEAEGARVSAVIELLRLASSGGTILRGGADHSASDFIARFCFLASSILVPPMRPQDRSRIALLQLLPLDTSRRPPLLNPDLLRTLGRRLLRRMADMWPLLAERLDTWREALLVAGYDARGGDQFGTLLACADVLLHDTAPSSDEIAAILEPLVANAVHERAEEMPDWQRCLTHLTTTIANAWRGGEQSTIGTLIARAAGRHVERAPPGQQALNGLPSEEEQSAAQDVLAGYGLRVERQGEVVWLAVANVHTSLAAMYRDTHWRALSGATGAWRQALLRVPGAKSSPNSVRFRGVKQRAVLVPVEWALGEMGE